MHDEIQSASWKQQWSIGRYLLLGTVIATVVNILLLLAKASFYIPYCGAVPYYLTFFGFYFDGNQAGSYTTTGIILAFPWLAAYLIMWWRANYSVRWLVAGLVLVIIDTVALALFTLLMTDSLGSLLLEFIFHIVVIYEIAVGIRAKRKMDAHQPEEPFAAEDWDMETPADSEYTDTL